MGEEREREKSDTVARVKRRGGEGETLQSFYPFL
jgi:hypothetical protein